MINCSSISFFIFRHDIQNLRQENELLKEGSESQTNNRESVSSDGCSQSSMSVCHIDGATNSNWSSKGKIWDPNISEESDQDGKS